MDKKALVTGGAGYTGIGFSVKPVIDMARLVTGKTIDVVDGARRP